MYENFVYDIPTRVLFGSGSLNQLRDEKLPGRKALIVISNGTSTKKYGYLDRVQAELDAAGVTYELFDEVRANPSRENVMDGAAKGRAAGCDFVVALGGGSVMDCSKAIAMMMTNPGDIWDYSLSAEGGKKSPEVEAAPIVCITTSAGTGSEVDITAVISRDDVHEKTAIFYRTMYPTLSVVDCDLMMSVPPKFTAYQGMDAFFHASESVLNTTSSPIGRMFALQAIELVSQNLERAYRDGSDKEARANMALANTLAGYFMTCTSEHAMEHVMGGFHPQLVHGAGLIMISHAYYDFFAERKASEERMIRMAKAMGVAHAKSGKDFVDALDRLIASVGCADLKMSDAGITREELKSFPEMVHRVKGGNINADPVKLSDDDYLEIYEKSFR